MQKVIILGASSGIGKELAFLYAQNNWQVGIAGRRIELLDEIQKEHPNNILTSQIDVKSADCINQLNSLIEKLGEIDLFIYSSGIGWVNEELDVEKEFETNAVNVTGFTKCITHIFNYFKQKKSGHIATISSVASIKGLRQCPAYSASKKYQVSYLQSLSQSSHKHRLNIKFTTILPGFVATDFIKKDKKYPFKVSGQKAGKLIFKALQKQKRIAYIPFKWRCIAFIEKCIPNYIWEHYL